MPDDARTQADALLARIAAAAASIGRMEEAVAAEIERVRQAYAGRIHTLREQLAGDEKALKALARGSRGELFQANVERVDLPHGALLLRIERRVKRIKGMLARLEAAGETAAVKVAKSVDWDVIEKWEDGRLARLGTERIDKERFAYETKEAR